MGLGEEQIRRSLDALALREPAIARALAAHGYPAARARPRGYATLLRIIVGQQVSVAAANAIWARLETELGAAPAPEALLARPHADLRALGFSRQKAAYARSLCEMAAAGALDFEALPAEDEAAIAALMQVRGVGRWSAEIYLLFAEGRADIWPAGDLAVMAGIGAIMGHQARPDERTTRRLGQPWRPHRSALALLAWRIHEQAAAARSGKPSQDQARLFKRAADP